MEELIINMSIEENRSKKEQLLEFLEDKHISFHIVEGRISIEAYNQELEDAVSRANAGNIITQEDVRKEMESW